MDCNVAPKYPTIALLKSIFWALLYVILYWFSFSLNFRLLPSSRIFACILLPEIQAQFLMDCKTPSQS